MDDDTSENFDQLMRSCADKALKCFDVLKDSPGVWDIFITKQVQVPHMYIFIPENKVYMMQLSLKDKPLGDYIYPVQYDKWDIYFDLFRY